MSIKWQDSWNIEVGEIDNQHRALVEQVSHLLEALKGEIADRKLPVYKFSLNM